MALTSRIQASRFVADGSTFRTVDTDAVVTTTDRSFRPVDTAVGPDGAVYFADWCDIRMDHTDPRDTWDKSCGRIWRLRASGYRPGGSVQPRCSGAARSSSSCSATSESGTAIRHGGCSASVKTSRSLPDCGGLRANERGQLALEALWTANLISGMDSEWALDLLAHPDAPVRSWTVRLLNPTVIERAAAARQRLVVLARSEPDAEVRSELAYAAARLEPDAALAVLQELIRRERCVGQAYSAADLVGPREEDHPRRGSAS